MILTIPQFNSVLVDIEIDDEDYNLFKLYDSLKWRVRHDGYVTNKFQVKFKTKEIFLHKLVLGLHNSKIIVDHKDRNKLNCKKNNLRPATCTTNRYNSIGKRNGTSKYKGVSWNKSEKLWRSFISIKGKSILLIRTLNEEEAAYAYNVAANIIAGEFACAANDLKLTQERMLEIESSVIQKL